jgi:hypothetical protein
MDKEYMNEAARAVDAKLPDNHGFILLAVPFGEGENKRLTYISSMKREDAIKVLKEWFFHIGEAENWMEHIK